MNSIGYEKPIWNVIFICVKHFLVSGSFCRAASSGIYLSSWQSVLSEDCGFKEAHMWSKGEHQGTSDESYPLRDVTNITGSMETWRQEIKQVMLQYLVLHVDPQNDILCKAREKNKTKTKKNPAALLFWPHRGLWVYAHTIFFFKTGICYVDQADLEFPIFLPQPLFVRLTAINWFSAVEPALKNKYFSLIISTFITYLSPLLILAGLFKLCLLPLLCCSTFRSSVVI